jgi:hypothetical protein
VFVPRFAVLVIHGRVRVSQVRCFASPPRSLTDQKTTPPSTCVLASVRAAAAAVLPPRSTRLRSASRSSATISKPRRRQPPLLRRILPRVRGAVRSERGQGRRLLARRNAALAGHVLPAARLPRRAGAQHGRVQDPLLAQRAGRSDKGSAARGKGQGVRAQAARRRARLRRARLRRLHGRRRAAGELRRQRRRLRHLGTRRAAQHTRARKGR